VAQDRAASEHRGGGFDAAEGARHPGWTLDSVTGPVVATAVVALVAVLLVAYGTRNGSNIGPDSATYFSGARNLAAGRGYSGYDMRPITLFPPGFSATLAVARTAGIDPVTAARWLNAVAAGALCVLVFVLVRRHARYRWSPVLAAAAVGSMPAIFDTFSAAWTEPLFCVLAVVLLLVLESILARHARRPGLLYAAGALAALGFLYRYAGITLVAVGLIVVAIAARPDGPQATLARMARFLAAGAAVPIMLVAWNATRGAALGPRPSSAQTLGGMAHDFLTTFRGWLVGNAHPPIAAADGLLALAVVVTALGAAGFVATRPRRPDPLRSLLPSVVFVAVYVAYLVASELATALDPVGNRLLAPVIGPVVLLVTVCLESVVAWPRAVPRTIRIALVTILVAGWFATSIATSIDRARRNAPAATGYAAAWWTGSDLVAAVRRLPPGIAIFSNNPAGVYLATGRQPISNTPTTGVYRSRNAPVGIGAFRARLASTGRPAYLVWERIAGDTWDVTPAQLTAAGFRLAPVAAAHIGTVYRIAP
jgi:hypothetical protein